MPDLDSTSLPFSYAARVGGDARVLGLGATDHNKHLPEVSRDAHGRIAVITWTPHHHRTHCLASLLQAELYEPSPVWRAAPAPVRYALQALQTVIFLLMRRPNVVVFQNPPSICGVVLIIMGCVLRFSVWADAHSGVFNDPLWSRFRRLNRFIARRCAGVIVHTPDLASQILSDGGRAFVLAYPVLQPHSITTGKGSYIVAALSYSFDEPVDLIIRAARDVPHVQVVCTGDPPPELVAEAPANCRFSGWLSRRDYERLLAGARGVVSLTTRDETMQTGGFEAVERALPLITSDFAALRTFHHEGALFVKCEDPRELGVALEEVWTNWPLLRQGALRERERFLRNTQLEYSRIVAAMDSMRL